MKKRSVGLALVALLFLCSVPFAASGCGHSLEGDYIRVCKAACVAGDDCEDFTKIVVDRDKCERDCDDNADNFAADTEDQCNKEYEIDGGQVDRCASAWDHFGAACRADDNSEINSTAQEVLDECTNETFVRCK